MKKFFLLLLTFFGGLTWAELNFEQLCLNKSLNEIVAHPQDCSGYILCSEKPSAHYCEAGFHFDFKHLVCNWPENVSCQVETQPEKDIKEALKPVNTPLMAINITSGEVVDPMVGYDPSNVICRHFGAYFLPNPKQCRKYYLCAYGHMHEHTCGPNTLWNYKTEQCELSHQALCYYLAAAEENEIENFYPSNMQNISMICYPVNQTLWNQTNPVTPTTNPIPTPPTLTSTSSKQPNLSNPYNITCPTKRQSYVPHPEDCSKYFICLKGTPVMTSCPKDLLWDAKRENCVVTKKVKCFQNKII